MKWLLRGDFLKFQFLDNPEYWLSAVFVAVSFKLVAYVFNCILTYIKQDAVEEYKKKHSDDE